MKYNVKTMRDAGLECKWGRTRNGGPCLFARYPHASEEHQRNLWWMIDRKMFESMEKVGIVEAFINHTLLGNIFAI